MILALPSPDDVKAILSLPVVVSYWPLLLGGLVLFVMAVKRVNWAILPIAAAFGLLQAWHSGLLNA